MRVTPNLALLGALFLAGCATPPRDASVTFVVMGDNRGGDATGEQPAAFHDLVRDVVRIQPEFVWNTGDMIHGRTNDLAVVRMQWDRYRATIAPLRMPIHHVPGNHDVWSEESRAIYETLWGPLTFAIERGPLLFLALDTESMPGRVGADQLAWLRERLAGAGLRRVVVVLHRPLFPVASHRASSLDAGERDALHAVLVENRDRIASVFAGHEHLFHHEVRDGIRYYTTGGGGADLHAPPERGGVHHVLVVTATPTSFDVEVRRSGRTPAHRPAPRVVEPGERIEGWESNALWTAWDYSVESWRTTNRASVGTAALVLDVDLARCGWPVLYTPFPREAAAATAWEIDVHAPSGAPDDLTVTPMAVAERSFEASPTRLTNGWNRVRADVAAWRAATGSIDMVQWVVTSTNRAWRGEVAFDRARWISREVEHELDSWEGALVWNVWSEAVRASRVEAGAAEGRWALSLDVPRAETPPTLLAGRANTPLDARRVRGLGAEVAVDADGVSVSLEIRSRDVAYESPRAALDRGPNSVRIPFDAAWAPDGARGSIEQVGWLLHLPADAPPVRVTVDAIHAWGTP